MAVPTFRKGKLLGSGVYGKVYEAERENDGKHFAIKVNLGNTCIDGMISLTDLNLSYYTNGHPSFVDITCLPRIPFREKLDRIIISPGDPAVRYDNLFFMMEIAETTLDSLILEERADEFVPHIRTLLAEILIGLEFIHAHKIVHRDIKANNILIYYDENNKPHAKIADYGFAHFLSKEKNTIQIQNYICRAPEVAARSPYYTGGIDIWSLGITLYSMLTFGKRPYSGREPARMTDDKILERIHQAFDLKGVTYPNVPKFMIDGITYIQSMRSFEGGFKRNIHPKIKAYYSEEHLFDLLSNMLNVRLEERYTATQCLGHSFFTEDLETAELIRSRREQTGVKPNGCIRGARNYIIVSDSPVRKLMFKYAEDVKVNAPNLYPWFTYQIWFAAIDLFDRWLVWELKTTDREVEEEDIFLAYYSCLYIMLKTCSSRKTYSLKSIRSDLVDYRESFKELERIIINHVSDGHIFRPTIYDEMATFDPETDYPRLKQLMFHKLPQYDGEHWKKLAKSYSVKYKKVEIADPPPTLSD